MLALPALWAETASSDSGKRVALAKKHQGHGSDAPERMYDSHEALHSCFHPVPRRSFQQTLQQPILCGSSMSVWFSF